MKIFQLIVLCIIATTTTLQAENRSRKLLIALDEWPPLEYTENGVLKGINVEVISRIMKRLEIPVEFKSYPFARGLMMAERGKVDGISSISYKPDRENIVWYTDEQRAFFSKGTYPTNYLWKGEYVFFLQPHHASSFQFSGYGTKGFKNYRVGVVKSYSYNSKFRNADMTRIIYPSAPAAFAALGKGEIDLVPMELTVGMAIKHDLGLGKKITYHRTPLIVKPYYLAFTKKSSYPGLEGLSSRFHEELAKMRASGEYDSIYESYIRPEYIKNITRPLTFVCEEWAPLEYQQGDEVKGVDAEVVKYIMTRLGIPYKISIFPWSRAWMMAEKGKADAVLSVSYKKSRESVLFYTEDQRKFGQDGTAPENYLWMSEYVFFVMKRSAKSIKYESYAQLKKDGVRVGRNRDYSYNPDFLAAKFSGPVYAKTEAGILALVSGEIDLYPMDKTVGSAVLKRLGLQDSVTWLQKPLFSKPYLSPFCKKSDLPELEKIMNTFYRELRLMRADGTYEEIYSNSLKAVKTSK